MAALKLTEKVLKDATAPPGARLELSDAACPGLRFRVTAAGAKSWAVAMRPKGGAAVERITLGRFPELSLAGARERANALRAERNSGENPATKVRAAKKTVALTFDKLADDFTEKHVAQKVLYSQKQDAWLLKLPRKAWGRRSPKSITRGDVAVLLDGIAEATPIKSNRVRACVGKLFSWALERELVDHNPVRDVRRRGKERSKDRALDLKELRDFLAAIRADDCPAELGMRIALQLILATGARPGEVAGLGFAELRLEGKAPVWNLPAERSKNRTARTIPLSKWAVKLIGQARAAGTRRQGGASFLFPSKYLGDAPLARNSLSQSFLVIRKHAKLAAFTPHDLRRTAATLAREAGATYDGVAFLLGHRMPGVTAVYDRSRFDEAARHAVDLIAELANS